MPVAIVTGASRGLGASIAEGLRDRGYVVPSIPRERMDVRYPDQVARTVNEVVSDYGRVDCLVNNAAILGPVGPLDECSVDSWTGTIQTNLVGPMLVTRAVLVHMKQRKSGRIVNIAGGGATNPLPRRSAYAASKAGLVRFTECIAAEMKEFGIEANAMLPGPLPTDMMDEIIASGPNLLGDEEYQAHTNLRGKSVGALERATALCIYLATDDSRGLTGKTLSARYDKWPVPISDLMSSDRFTLRRVDDAASAK